MKIRALLKKGIFFLAVFCFNYSMIAQPLIEWQQNSGGSNDERIYDGQQTTDGGYIFAGYTRSNDGDVSVNRGGGDARIIKLNTAGDLEWEKTYGGVNNERVYTIQQTTDGGYIAAGYSYSDNGDVGGNFGQEDIWVIKTDALGNLEWEQNYGGENEDRAETIRQTTDGGYIIAGHSFSNTDNVSGNNGLVDCWIIKINATGNIVWEKNYGGSGRDRAYDVQQTTDGGYIVAGLSVSNDGDVGANNGEEDFWILKLSPSGNLQWEKNFGGSSDDWANSVQQTADGGYMIAGVSSSNDIDVGGNNGLSDYWLIKLSPSGNLVWEKNFGGADADFGRSIQQTTEGGFIISGISQSSDGDVSDNYGEWDFWVVKLNPFGTLEWEQNYGGSQIDVPSFVQQTTDEGYMIGGYSRSNDGDVSTNNGGWDTWMVKLTAVPTSVTNLDNQLEMTLSPNPSNGNFSIELEQQTEEINIQIFDVLGKLVYFKTSAILPVKINDFPKGQYSIYLYNDDFLISEKFLSK